MSSATAAEAPISRRAARKLAKSTVRAEARKEAAQRAIGYVRVSTEEQAESGFGLDVQERAIRAFALSQGYELVDVIADRGVSGASRPMDREGFSRLVAVAKRERASVLLLWKFDRLARHMIFAVVAVDELREKHGMQIRSVTEAIDTATPMGEMVFGVLAGMAGMERKAIVERTIGGRKAKAGDGGFAGGAAPLGYRRDLAGGLAVDEEEAETVRRASELREAGSTLQAIADTLTAEGRRTKRGGRWHPGTVSYLLDNQKYLGRIEYAFEADGVSTVINRPGEHEPILKRAAEGDAA
ncbi:DNA invertase Pin-like site-specific DNA recombinase [Azospirillum baldaniorum]|uniref:recombinase family protein n=1 Tax=Azospirillum baldaniorum TaxID=1064539 RepID=UPI0011A72622|nr:recombinase family protein [Azospirillum baldaniorum]TWA71896.1 DNA invertase Pin-like site-specific DNA recombinase [Azospirillum baldaniorum]